MKQALSAVTFCLIFAFDAIAGAPTTFTEAKIVAKRNVFFDQADGQVGELYCGCNWQWVGKSGGRVDGASCGFVSRKQPVRAKRTEWEHIVPAWQFGHQRQCWQNGGRKNCVSTDPVFRMMEADLFNLYPSIGEVNGDRANFNYGMVSGPPSQYGACTTKIDFDTKTAEPRDEVKGLVARTTFYMFDRYNLNMSRQQQQLLMAWSKQHPVSSWELERNDRISKIIGHTNPFVTGDRVWSIGYTPSGDGIAARSSASAGKKAPNLKVSADTSDTPVIGNRRSGVYHMPVGCPSYDQVSAKNLVQFESESEALSKGFRKAGNCR